MEKKAGTQWMWQKGVVIKTQPLGGGKEKKKRGSAAAQWGRGNGAGSVAE